MIVSVNGEPVGNLQIGHIRAAKPDGPRYDPNMTGDERRRWPNLIFLCTPHHTYVDKIKPQDFPITVLEKWKSDREKEGLARLKGLNDLTEDRLQEIIADAWKQATTELQSTIARLKPIDPDLAILLSHAAKRLNIDTADALYSASRNLTPALNPGNVEMLYHAAATLRQLNFAQTVSQLSDTVEQLSARIKELRRFRDVM